MAKRGPKQPGRHAVDWSSCITVVKRASAGPAAGVPCAFGLAEFDDLRGDAACLSTGRR